MEQLTDKLWVVSGPYYPEESGTGYLLTQLAEGLAKSDSVHVLCGRPNTGKDGLRFPHKEEHEGVWVERCFSTMFPRDRIMLRTINELTLSLSIFTKVLFGVRRNDSVLVVTPPPALPFTVALACKLRNVKCHLLIHDVYPDALVAAGVTTADSPLARSMDRLNRWLYHNVERIVVLGRDMEQLIARKAKSSRLCLVPIPNWTDGSDITPQPREENPLLRELNLQDKFVVQYAGNMGRTHGLETVLQSAVRLRENPDVHFLFIGTGAKKKYLEQAVRDQHLTNVTLLPSRPRCDQPNFLNACDLAIISFMQGMAGVSVPSRMYNIMAAGKPILAVTENTSELAQVVHEEEIGWVTPPNDADKIVEAICEAMNHPDRLDAMGRRARRAAEDKYLLEHAIAAYRTVIQEARGLDLSRAVVPEYASTQPSAKRE